MSLLVHVHTNNMGNVKLQILIKLSVGWEQSFCIYDNTLGDDSAEGKQTTLGVARL